MSTITSLEAQRSQVLLKGQAVIDRAKAENRDLTASEIKQVDEVHDLVRGEIDPAIIAAKKKAKDSSALFDAIGALGNDESTSDAFRLFGRGAKSHAANVAERMLDRSALGDGRKALLTGASVELDPGAASISLDIHNDPRLPLTFLELLPGVRREAAQYVYMQQVGRDNQAAIVPAGEAKPTSIYSAGPKQGSLQVFAHMSEPIDQYLLSDVSTLSNFLQAEMLYGLQVAVEDEVLNGDGSAGHLTGLLQTSGIQVQTPAADALTTLRAAATKIEVLGFNANAFVLNPLDWEAIETARNSSGSFDLGGPVDRAARTVWGTQVTLSTRLPQGTGVALDTQVVSVDYDSTGVKFEAGTVGEDFLRNQIRFRNEGRFGVAVYQPAGVVQITLSDD
ncbi:phage major capsid protein [Aeromicrobium piscarium]|nr:phage major capsid protein [Aeromicrobium piscarium]